MRSLCEVSFARCLLQDLLRKVSLARFFERSFLQGLFYEVSFMMSLLQVFFSKVSLERSFAKSLANKGQIKPKADWRAIDSPKKLMEFVFFDMTVQKYLKHEVSIYGASICHVYGTI